MAEFKAGDRVVKMSGTGAGKYGTVNSVAENGTLNVTFDGERLPRYCDPERCGQVAANATFKKGDRVKLKGSSKLGTVVGGMGTYIGAGSLGGGSDYPGDVTVRWDSYKFDVPVKPENLVFANAARNAKFKPGDKVKVGRDVATIVREEGDDDPSIPGEIIYLVRFVSRPGSATVAESEIKSANSRARNANGWPNARMKFKTGDKVRHRTNGLDGVVEGWASDPGQYRVRASGRVYEWDEDDLVLANAVRNAVARNGDIDNDTARRDIDLSLRKMADIASRISRAKATSKATHDEYMFAGYIDLNFPDADSADAFNPYDVIYVLRDNKGILPKWAWGVGGFNYERRGNSWRIHIGRFAT